MKYINNNFISQGNSSTTSKLKRENLSLQKLLQLNRDESSQFEAQVKEGQLKYESLVKLAEQMIYILLSNNLEKEIEANKEIYAFVKTMKIDYNAILTSKRSSLVSYPSYQISKSKAGEAGSAF